MSHHCRKMKCFSRCRIWAFRDAPKTVYGYQLTQKGSKYFGVSGGDLSFLCQNLWYVFSFFTLIFDLFSNKKGREKNSLVGCRFSSCRPPGPPARQIGDAERKANCGCPKGNYRKSYTNFPFSLIESEILNFKSTYLRAQKELSERTVHDRARNYMVMVLEKIWKSLNNLFLCYRLPPLFSLLGDSNFRNLL